MSCTLSFEASKPVPREHFYCSMIVGSPRFFFDFFFNLRSSSCFNSIVLKFLSLTLSG